MNVFDKITWFVYGCVFATNTSFEPNQSDFYIGLALCWGSLWLLVYATKKVVYYAKQTKKEYEQMKLRRKH